MRNSVPMGSLQGIHESNIGLKGGDNSLDFSSNFGYNSYMGSSSMQETPKDIESTDSYLNKITQKYDNQDDHNVQNNNYGDHHNFPVARKQIYEKKDGTMGQRMTIKNSPDKVPTFFKQQEQRQNQYQGSERFRNSPQKNSNLYTSGRIQQPTEYTNFGRNQQQQNTNNNRPQNQNYNNNNFNNNSMSSYNNNNNNNQQFMQTSHKNTNIQKSQQQQYQQQYNNEQSSNYNNNQDQDNNFIPMNSLLNSYNNTNIQRNFQQQSPFNNNNRGDQTQKKQRFWEFTGNFVKNLPAQKRNQAPMILDLYNMAEEQYVQENQWGQFLKQYFNNLQ